jgi:hypothetical protein
MYDRERVSDERLRGFVEYPANWMRADYFKSVAAELLDARDRIARAVEALDYQHIEGAGGVGYVLAVDEARALLTGDES